MGKEIITWERISGDKKGISLRRSVLAGNVDLNDWEDLRTDDVISAIQASLMGEYHAIVIKESEETAFDSEFYLLTWDEIIEGGEMCKIDYYMFVNIVNMGEAKGENLQ